MRIVITALSFLCLGSAFAQKADQATGDQKIGLRLALVASTEAEDEQRTRTYASFLRAHFTDCAVISHADARGHHFQGVDVVLLDWDQQDGVMSWGRDAGARDKALASCPLGKREAWTTPTVLIGSAGLNIASVWEVRGSFG